LGRERKVSRTQIFLRPNEGHAQVQMILAIGCNKPDMHFMTRSSKILLPLLLAFLVMAMTPACASKKTGCPINEKATTGTDRKGNLKTKKKKNNLFGPTKRKIFVP
jgi:hypothetical protein